MEDLGGWGGHTVIFFNFRIFVELLKITKMEHYRQHDANFAFIDLLETAGLFVSIFYGLEVEPSSIFHEYPSVLFANADNKNKPIWWPACLPVSCRTKTAVRKLQGLCTDHRHLTYSYIWLESFCESGTLSNCQQITQLIALTINVIHWLKSSDSLIHPLFKHHFISPPPLYSSV